MATIAVVRDFPGRLAAVIRMSGHRVVKSDTRPDEAVVLVDRPAEDVRITGITRRGDHILIPMASTEASVIAYFTGFKG